MQISLITPVYEDPRVERALESVATQEGDFELERIVVDGGSGEPVASILHEHEAKIDVLISEPDDGIYDAMNKGIEAASGDVVGILNADDVYAHDQVLQRVVETLEETAADTCYGDLVYTDEDDRPVRYWRAGSHRTWKWSLGWMPPHPTFFARRSVYEEYGTFDESFPISADYEFMLRVLRAGQATTTYIPDLLTRMSLGGTSNESAASILQANREVAQAWSKHGLSGGLAVAAIKPARKLGQFVSAFALRSGVLTPDRKGSNSQRKSTTAPSSK